MKKIFSVFLCLVFAFSLCACGGNVENVKIKDVKSEIYSDDDIKSAINVIIEEFDKDWDGCTLKEIGYAGDAKAKGDQEYYAKVYNVDEAIILISTFDVDSSGGDGSLEPNDTYTDWNWILTRNNGGEWKHADHGFV